MSRSNFVHLRVHSAYSLSEGAIRIKELVKLCSAQGMPAVAVTDSGNLFGAMEFSLAAAGAGIQPIIGCVLAVYEAPEEVGARPRPMERILLLVQNETGYRNLLKLVSKSFLETPDDQEPHVGYGDLERWSEGLLLLTGGVDGPLSQALLAGDEALAHRLAGRFKAIFPDRCYIEVQRHGLADELAVEERLIQLAYSHDLPLVATNDAFFTRAGQFEAHDALLCIAGSTYVLETDRRRLSPEYRFKSAEEMEALFEDLPEAVANTAVIARRCAFFPQVVKPILPPFDTEEGRGEAAELRAQAEAGLERRLAAHVYAPHDDQPAREAKAAPYRERLACDLGIIEDMGFPGYFLIVADFIKWAKTQEIPVGPGRGSGAGSLVAYALTITELDPLRWDLLFERFLNPERVSMPDFDVDFCQERRDEVIQDRK